MVAFVEDRKTFDTKVGDTDLDGNVDLDDSTEWGSGFGPATGWSDGDLNGDGEVDAADTALGAANFPWQRP